MAEQTFKDYFSRQSALYRQSRPGYPEELFAWLASLVPSAHTVWDCATGNGQAAVSLARYFPRIIATDASEKQIGNAVPHDRVEYRITPAEHSGLPERSVDLVTVATAAHWFEHTAFYSEVERVLRPGGVLAVWTYHNTKIEPAVDRIVNRYMNDILHGYWPNETRYVVNRYEDLPFPFPLLDAPAFYGRVRWTLGRLIAFFMSWSSTQNYIAAHGTNPLEQILPALQEVWGDPEGEREVTWDLALKAGRKPL